MRESMPGRLDPEKPVYDPDEPRPPSEWQQMCDALAPIRQRLRTSPRPDEFQVAAAKADRQKKHRRDARWHRANQALGGT